MITKDEVVRLAREIYAKKYGDVEPWKGCLYWAGAFEEAAKGYGMDRVLIQAGSAQFQFRKDNGTHDTHFSYMWDQNAAMERLRRGLPPEMHAWNAVQWRWEINSPWEIVDLTTRYQAQQAKDMQGLIWQPEFALPDYYWDRPDSMRLVYHADVGATMFALAQLDGFRKARHERTLSNNSAD